MLSIIDVSKIRTPVFVYNVNNYSCRFKNGDAGDKHDPTNKTNHNKSDRDGKQYINYDKTNHPESTDEKEYRIKKWITYASPKSRIKFNPLEFDFDRLPTKPIIVESLFTTSSKINPDVTNCLSQIQEEQGNSEEDPNEDANVAGFVLTSSNVANCLNQMQEDQARLVQEESGFKEFVQVDCLNQMQEEPAKSVQEESGLKEIVQMQEEQAKSVQDVKSGLKENVQTDDDGPGTSTSSGSTGGAGGEVRTRAMCDEIALGLLLNLPRRKNTKKDY